MEFAKVEGLGNDFILLPNAEPPDPADVQRWCVRRTGVGADGVLTAWLLRDGRVEMRYWNADGGEVEMCGNGLRCVARYAVEEGWVDGHDVVVVSPSGEHPVSVGEDAVRAFVGVPHRFRTDTLPVAGRDVHPVGIGNPHAVLFVDDVATAPVAEVGPQVENDPLFPNRTNVEFVEVVDEQAIKVRVWERGVGETPASGTGAIAAAFVAHDRDRVAAPVRVVLTGGELEVQLEEDGAWMVGPATVVYRGEL